MPTLNDAKVRIMGTFTNAIKEDDGAWKLITRMEEKISFDGEHFEERVIEKMSIDKDFKRAFDTAFKAVLAEAMTKIAPNGSLFLEYVNDNVKTNKAVQA